MSLISRLWIAALKAAPLRLWVLFAAGPALTAAAAALVAVIKDPSWPLDLRGKQLDFLGWSLIGVLMLIGVIVITLAAVRVKVTGPADTQFEVDPGSE